MKNICQFLFIYFDEFAYAAQRGFPISFILIHFNYLVYLNAWYSLPLSILLIDLTLPLFSPPRIHDFDENTKGIPEFWLTIFKNVDLLAEMVQDYDEPILKHLTDIQLKFHDEPMGFTLEFYFTENEYFTNKVLTKYYEMKCVPDKDDPFGFEGPEIFKCKVSHSKSPLVISFA